jgi:DNA-binding NtrC family response regulator
MIRPRILIVDDEETIRNTLSIILKDEGYIVDTAETGFEALKKISEINFNVALIDIKLPDIEGTTLLSKMKPAIPKLRKVILTGHPTISNAIDAVNRNADAYLLKPVKVDDLLNIISQQLKLQEEEEKISERKVAEFVEDRIEKLNNRKK